MRYLWALALALAGCAAQPSPDDPPPADGVVAPRLAPPPARGDALSREEALALARAHEDPADAIDALDQRRFAFDLDEPTLEWFGRQGLDPQAQDYLRKRARVDWEALRGDIDPEGPR